MTMTDIEHLIDNDYPETMNFCPICDDPVGVHEEAEIVTAFGFKTLAHAHCVKDG